MGKIVLAVDLGGTNLRMATVTSNGKILSRVKNKTPRSDNPSEIVNAIAKSADECFSNLSDFEKVSLAVAVPGIINVKEGLVYNSPNLQELNGYKIADSLKNKLNINAVLENDANAAAIGENWLGASANFDNSIMVTLGTGVGGGIIINGEVLRGVDGTAGEVGHINAEPKGYNCGCGSFGCVEQYTSATAIVRIAHELAVDKPNYIISDFENLTSEDIYQLAIDGDETANEVFAQQGYYLGIMLAGLINTLNTEVVVIGGGAAAGWDLFAPHLREEMNRRSYREPSERVKIVQAELGDDAGILGVAKLGFNKML